MLLKGFRPKKAIADIIKNGQNRKYNKTKKNKFIRSIIGFTKLH